MLSSRALLLGLLLSVWSWLVYDHYRPWMSFHSEAVGWAAGAMFALSALFAARADLGRTARLVPVIAVVALVPWLQWMGGVSGFAGDAVLASLYIVGFAFAVYVGFSERPEAAGGRAVPLPLVAVALAAVLSATVGLMQWLSVQDLLGMYGSQTDPGDRAMGNLGQPNHLASLLLVGAMVFLLAYERGQLRRLALFTALGFLTLVLLLTDSRAGLVSLLAIAIFLGAKGAQGHVRVRPFAAIAWVGMFLACRPLVPLVHEALLIGGGRGIGLTDHRARVLIWKQIWEGIQHAPWFGYGWNQTPTAHAAGAIAHPGTETLSHAHSVVLDLMAWNGIPLGLLLCGLCAWWLVTRAWRVREARGIYAMAALIPLTVHSLVEYPFAYGYFLVPAGLLVGMVEASIPGAATVRLPVQALRATLAAWMVMGSVVVYEYFLVEKDFQIVRFQNLRIGKTPADYVPPEIHVLSHMGTMLKMARVVPAPGMDPQVLHDLERVAQRFPYGALAVRNALAKGLNGDPEGASHQMAVIYGMYGPGYYRAAKAHLLGEQQKYPELKDVVAH